MKLTPHEIEEIALLARLELSDSEKEIYAEQLSVIFDYIEILNEVDTEDVEETCQVTGLMNVTREDTVGEPNDAVQQKIINAFPEKVGSLLKVKKVFE
ncbi:MAG: Asp-tRNA(Asn)/Glu-tRNA(Gln) amidotransferase GatCAB subunit C [Candidatus Magasanikbacteria bacterium CG11_big_fil_rev_8_21_14_0_20_39_34]|uniref:Aspartyl/glutamyl-tRNA(Asn/Gln) amidotransferase subunit C n=1 Tax=Candidatus Magasanikbacteria bacterium CG11_big_fil_rev_8_21_14_0_20_39_34 TaxID=1974653 RepID=A0A2H0N5L0_9BACT|nr:MAG: Asp-tRNA(Asn)/Glu-tRNA(Gln) amidotransferase GatCAB subunit C [Candidatus Magasanikbacteria bacterium CG11_big_fil_rev_8_21_14_0_20_39_34]